MNLVDSCFGSANLDDNSGPWDLDNPTLVFIHGANCTKDSFNFIDLHFTVGIRIFLEYSCNNSFFVNLEEMVTKLRGHKDIVIIGHSLGGVYALHLANKLGEAVIGGISLATPFGGSESAVMLSLVKPCQLYFDICPTSTPIMLGNRIKLGIPWTALVTSKGHSHLMSSANDGVVTTASMKIRSDMEFVEVGTNHHEVLARLETIGIIKNSISKMYVKKGFMYDTAISN